MVLCLVLALRVRLTGLITSPFTYYIAQYPTRIL